MKKSGNNIYTLRIMYSGAICRRISKLLNARQSKRALCILRVVCWYIVQFVYAH